MRRSDDRSRQRQRRTRSSGVEARSRMEKMGQSAFRESPSDVTQAGIPRSLRPCRISAIIRRVYISGAQRAYGTPREFAPAHVYGYEAVRLSLNIADDD